MSNVIAKTNDYYSHRHFELLNLILADKLKFWMVAFIGGLFVTFFFITEVSNFIAKPKNNFSQNHFEPLNLILDQKLTILEGGLH